MGDNSGGVDPPDENNSLQNPNTKDNNISDPEVKSKQYDLENKYRTTDNGPYYVMVEHEDKNIGRLFPIRIGHYLLSDPYLKQNILDIKAVGLNRVKIICKTYNSANNLINHNALKTNKLIAYIPKYYTQKKGVIKMVDTSFTEEYISNAIESNIRVMDVKRMKRRVYDESSDTTTYVDRQMVILTFLGNKVPQNVRINMVNFPVDPYYYPVIQCFKCLRYGHTSNQCRGKPRCKTCGSDSCKDDPCQDEEQKCIYCSSTDHNAVSRKCPVFKKQANIKKVMATENVSFKEAEFIVDNPSYAKVTTHNRFSLLDPNSFPVLTEPTTNFVLQKPSTNKPLPFKNTNSQRKKRKAVSPPSTPPAPEKTNKSKPVPIIPNPYRDEFVQHKERIICQMIQLVQNAVHNNQNLNEASFKNNISQILETLFLNDVNMDTVVIDDDEFSEY